MKFQDSSLNGLKVTVGTKKCDPRTLQKQLGYEAVYGQGAPCRGFL